MIIGLIGQSGNWRMIIIGPLHRFPIVQKCTSASNQTKLHSFWLVPQIQALLGYCIIPENCEKDNWCRLFVNGDSKAIEPEPDLKCIS